MNTNGKRPARPTRSQTRKDRAARITTHSLTPEQYAAINEGAGIPVAGMTDAELGNSQFSNAMRSIARAFESIIPRHLQACSRPGCVEPTVAVLDSTLTDKIERLCARHLKIVIDILEMASLADENRRRNARRRAEFALLSPIEQYQLEGR